MDAPFFHELRRQASSYVTPTQLMTEEATNGDASLPKAKTMSLIAREAFEIDEYLRISDILHSRLATFDRRQWREPYKALLLLEHLLTHGPRSVALEFQKDQDVIQQMATFQHIDERGFNWGLTVKGKSERVLKLLERGPFLEEERERARKVAREIKGFGSFNLSTTSSSRARLWGDDGAAPQMYGRSHSQYEDRPCKEEDGEDEDKENLVSRPDPRSVCEEVAAVEERHHHHPFHGFGQQRQPEAMLLLSQ